MTTSIRFQPVFVIQRKSDGRYWKQRKHGPPLWTDDLRLANLIARTKIKGKIRAEWGRDLEDYRVLEVAPALMPTRTSGEILDG